MLAFRRSLVRKPANNLWIRGLAGKRSSDLAQFDARTDQPPNSRLQWPNRLRRRWNQVEGLRRYSRINDPSDRSRSLRCNIPIEHFPNCCHSIRRNFRQLTMKKPVCPQLPQISPCRCWLFWKLCTVFSADSNISTKSSVDEHSTNYYENDSRTAHFSRRNCF